MNITKSEQIQQTDSSKQNQTGSKLVKQSTPGHLSQCYVHAAVQRIASGKNHPLQMRQDILTLQRTIGNQAVVQMLAQVQRQSGENGNTSTIQKIAEAGVQGNGSKLPHFEKIQASFGKYDVSHVQAYTGNQAATASRAIEAKAYTTGNKIAFANSNPSLHTAAHEAAHVVQQQAGVQLKGGVGEAGDQYEQHADAVADAVTQGKSAEALLASYNSNDSNTNNKLNQAIQNKNANSSSGLVVQRELQVKGSSLAATEYDGYLDLLAANGILSGLGLDKLKIKEYMDELYNDTKAIHNFQNTENKANKINRLVNYIQARHAKGTTIDLTTNYPGFIAFLKELINSNIEIQKIIRKPQYGRLAEVPDFYPENKQTERRSTDEESFDLSMFKTALIGTADPDVVITESDYDPALNKVYTKAADKNEALNRHKKYAKAEGLDITEDLKQSYKNAPLKVEVDSVYGTLDKLQTQIKWNPAEFMSGKKMVAFPLGPDHPLGSVPSDPMAKQAVTDMSTAANGVTFIAGHMLNEQLGGPGDDVRNLAPISSKANSAHKNEVEKHVKKLVNKEYKWIWYSVEVERSNMDTDVTGLGANDKRTLEGIRKRNGEKYVSAFVNEWGLLKASWDKTGATHILKVEKDANTIQKKKLTFEDPRAISKAGGVQNNIVPDTTGTVGGVPAGDIHSIVKPENVILSTARKVTSKLVVSSEYEPYIKNLELLNSITKHLKQSKALFESNTKDIALDPFTKFSGKDLATELDNKLSSLKPVLLDDKKLLLKMELGLDNDADYKAFSTAYTLLTNAYINKKKELADQVRLEVNTKFSSIYRDKTLEYVAYQEKEVYSKKLKEAENFVKELKVKLDEIGRKQLMLKSFLPVFKSSFQRSALKANSINQALFKFQVLLQAPVVDTVLLDKIVSAFDQGGGDNLLVELYFNDEMLKTDWKFYQVVPGLIAQATPPISTGQEILDNSLDMAPSNDKKRNERDWDQLRIHVAEPITTAKVTKISDAGSFDEGLKKNLIQEIERLINEEKLNINSSNDLAYDSETGDVLLEIKSMNLTDIDDSQKLAYQMGNYTRKVMGIVYKYK